MRIAITGAAGYLGHALVRHLENNNDCEYMLGISRRGWNHTFSKLEYHSMDVRSTGLSTLFAESAIDAVIHLAFVVNPLHNEQEMHSINREGTQNVLAAAAKAQVKKIITTSSTMVYGAWPDNPPQLPENAPQRGHPTYYYNKDKIAIEHLCQKFQKQHPDIMMTILRPCLVLGPTVDQFYSRILNWPLLPLVGGCDPPIQFVHEDDVARAYEHFLFHDASGSFNIVGTGTLNWREIVEEAGKRVVSVPSFLLYPLVNLFWRLHLIEIPPQVMDFIRYPWVASGEKAKMAGFIPEYSTQETLHSFLQDGKNF
jgi:UDP-glucose 4-epimerase